MRRYSISTQVLSFPHKAVMLVVFGAGVAVACGRLSGEQQALPQARARQADMFDQVCQLQQELSDAGTREYIERGCPGRRGCCIPAQCELRGRRGTVLGRAGPRGNEDGRLRVIRLGTARRRASRR